MQIMCNHDSLMIRFGSLERDYLRSNLTLTGLVHGSLFCQFLLLLYLCSLIHVCDSPFLSCHSKLSHDNDFYFISHYVRIVNKISSPTIYVLSTYFYKSNLRMSIGYLQPLVKTMISKLQTHSHPFHTHSSHFFPLPFLY